jgi:hypothetical protein
MNARRHTLRALATLAFTAAVSTTASAQVCYSDSLFVFDGQTCMRQNPVAPIPGYVNISLRGINSSGWTGGYPDDLMTTITCTVTTDVPGLGTVTVVPPFTETADGFDVVDGVNFSVPECTEYTATCTHEWSWFGGSRSLSFDTSVSLFADPVDGSDCPTDVFTDAVLQPAP